MLALFALRRGSDADGDHLKVVSRSIWNDFKIVVTKKVVAYYRLHTHDFLKRGMTVYTRELDDILYEHPAVEFAAAIGVTDPERPRSEKVRVYIQIKPEYKGKLKAEEFIDYLRGRVAKYIVPKYCDSEMICY